MRSKRAGSSDCDSFRGVLGRGVEQAHLRRFSTLGTAPACMGGSGPRAPSTVTFNGANPTEGDCGSQKQWSPEPPVHRWTLLAGGAALVDRGVWRHGATGSRSHGQQGPLVSRDCYWVRQFRPHGMWFALSAAGG